MTFESNDQNVWTAEGHPHVLIIACLIPGVRSVIYSTYLNYAVYAVLVGLTLRRVKRRGKQQQARGKK